MTAPISIESLLGQTISTIHEARVIGQLIYNLLAYPRVGNPDDSEEVKENLRKEFEESYQKGLDLFDELLKRNFFESGKWQLNLAYDIWRVFCITDTPENARRSLEIRIGGTNKYGIEPETSVDIEKEIDSWIHIKTEKRFFNPDDSLFYPLDSAICVAQMAYPEKSAAAVKKLLLTSPKIARTKVSQYRPGFPIIFTDKYPICNTWLGPSVIPKEGDCQEFIEHLQYLFGEDEYKYLHDWIAYVVQARTPRIQWVCVLTGDSGIGKSLIGEAVTKMLGLENVTHPTPETIRDKFADWPVSYQLAVINEFEFTTNKEKDEVYGRLKTLITDPRVNIRRMYAAGKDEAISTAMLFIGNDREFLNIDSSDRRYCVLHSYRKRDDKPIEYYKTLVNCVHNKVPELLYYFSHVDVSNFQIVNAPMTRSKLALINDNPRSAIKLFVEQNAPPLFTATELRDLVALNFPEMDITSSFLNSCVKDIVASLGRKHIGKIIKELRCFTKDFLKYNQLSATLLSAEYLKIKGETNEG